MAGDTIYAVSTGRPPAAIAIIRISGPRAHEAGAAIAETLPEPRVAAVRELRSIASGDLLDEALVLRFDGPATATGEDVVEFHCHGSRAVVEAVLGELEQVEGLREAQPGEFTRRAFENGRIDLTEAEGLADLLEAETESQRRAALRLAEGDLRRQVEAWQERLIMLSAAAERAIDYADEDDEAEDESAIAELRALSNELDDWLRRPRSEPLKDGVRVVVSGPPNAGKSSLINAIAGSSRIIVSEVMGTTRDVIEVPLSIDGIPFVFTDTAGIRDSEDDIESIGIGLAKEEIARADIVLWLGSPDLSPSVPRLIQVRAKADILGNPHGQGMAVSSKTGEGIAALLADVKRLARELLPKEGSLALNRRQASAIQSARDGLIDAIGAPDSAVRADSLRSARLAFDRLTGRAGIEDVLDALFQRFCLGK